MCFPKKPKAATAPAAAAEKTVPVLRNPYLDGIDPTLRAQQRGASSLRIDRAAPNPLGQSLMIQRTLPPPTGL